MNYKNIGIVVVVLVLAYRRTPKQNLAGGGYNN